MPVALGGGTGQQMDQLIDALHAIAMDPAGVKARKDELVAAEAASAAAAAEAKAEGLKSAELLKQAEEMVEKAKAATATATAAEASLASRKAELDSMALGLGKREAAVAAAEGQLVKAQGLEAKEAQRASTALAVAQ